MPADPGIAFAQNLVNKFMQFKMMQIQQQRYDEQLRLDRERNQLYTRNIESLITTRGQPERGTFEWFKKRGYSDEEAQLGQDRWNRLAPSAASPTQRILAGKTILGTATSVEDRDAGFAVIREGTKALREQMGIRTDADTPLFPSETPTPLFREPDFTQGMLPTSPNEGMFGRLEASESERVEVINRKTGERRTLPRNQLEQGKLEGWYPVKK